MASRDSFVHLHVHTDYSMLDGAAIPERLMSATAEQGMTAVAITDHGTMAGAFHAYKEAQKHGVKAIIGIEGYLSPGTPRSDKTKVKWADRAAEMGEELKDVAGDGAYTHLTLLSETTEGMHNLFRLSSLAYTEGFYYKPRMDREILEKYAKGVIATTGCPSGEVQTRLLLGQYEEARKAAADFRDIFGKENYFVELMDHGLGIEHRVKADLIRLAKDLGIPLVATNDLHYTYAHEADAHAALLCVQSGKNLDDPKRFKFDSNEFYLKSAAQMRHLFSETPEACDNTLLIAERCNVEFREGANLLPLFPVPEGHTQETWFEHEVRAGLEIRYPNGVPQDRIERAEYEIGVINQMGFPSYFLVTADFIQWAKKNGIRVGPGRGSAAGSIVAYALGITDLDPIRHGLLFERFLNPDRVSMPDIDVDFDERRRGEVIEYVINKYGADKVAQITTFMTIKAKAAIKDSARVLGYPYGAGERLTKAYPNPIMGKDLPLTGAYDPENSRYKEATEFRDLVASDPDAKKIVETARGIEGIKRGFGVHAAGIIMSSEPLIDNIPIMMREADGSIITQFEYPTCEKLGLLKMDFLGLSNLATIDECLRQVKITQGIDIDLEEIIEKLDDKKTYDLLARGDTLGVFQLDSGPIRSLLRQMKPDCFEDVSATIALYRPGPMGVNAHIDYADRKNKRKPIKPIHKELEKPLEDILGDTYGLIVYQEQVMAIAQRVAGYSLGGADLLRRAMGKKDKKILAKEFIPFSGAMRERGYSQESIDTLWEILVPFADYAFNRAHSAGYGLISYITAYLKANYAPEYMAALLTTNAHDKDKTAIYLAECRAMGIKVLPPDVNESDEMYMAINGDIRVGLIAIKNVGANVVEKILETRKQIGKLKSFAEWLDNADPIVCRKRVVESLIKAGAFDSFGKTRHGLFLAHEAAVDAFTSNKKNKKKDQDSLFSADVISSLRADIAVPDVPEWNKKVLLAYEREMLGLYVSDHPLSQVAVVLKDMAGRTIVDIRNDPPAAGAEIRVGGLLSSVQRKITRKGDAWAMLTVEDLDASMAVYCFPRTYQQYQHLLIPDTVVMASGRIEHRDDGTISLTLSKIEAPDMSGLDGALAAPLNLYVNEGELDTQRINKLRTILSGHPGKALVRIHVKQSDGTRAVIALGADLTIQRSGALISELKELLGVDCLTE